MTFLTFISYFLIAFLHIQEHSLIFVLHLFQIRQPSASQPSSSRPSASQPSSSRPSASQPSSSRPYASQPSSSRSSASLPRASHRLEPLDESADEVEDVVDVVADDDSTTPTPTPTPSVTPTVGTRKRKNDDVLLDVVQRLSCRRPAAEEIKEAMKTQKVDKRTAFCNYLAVEAQDLTDQQWSVLKHEIYSRLQSFDNTPLPPPVSLPPPPPPPQRPAAAEGSPSGSDFNPDAYVTVVNFDTSTFETNVS
jgi:hypothetical protein